MPIRLVHDRWVSKYRAPFAAALSDLKSRLEHDMAETQVYELFIRTTPEKLWQALTDRQVTKKYFFGEEIHSDWKPGSEWYSTSPEGRRDVDGKVLECDPPRGEMCKLSVTHDVTDAPKTAGHVSKDGWQWVLSSLKSLLETGQHLPMRQ
jgi:hypothetical protein